MIDQIQQHKGYIERYRLEAEQAERSGDYGRVAELRYGKIKESEEQIIRLKAQLESKQKSQALIREEVSSEDIARNNFV